jgi:sugar phosphate isomerase/epimerase
MPESDLTRRNWLAIASATATAGVLASGSSTCAAAPRADEPFVLGLNTSTIRGQNLPITREAELAAQAGFRGIEPWISELDAHVKAGGSLEQLGKQFRDLNLSVESAIGFFEWAADDEARRRKGLDEARRNLELVRAIGGKRLAAPPVGLTDRTDVHPKRLAERYRTLLELGDSVGVVPQVEVWGFSKTLGRLGEAADVAIGADHPKACILADVYHLYKGGSGFHGIKLLGKDAIHVFHLNDYPAKPPRETITDADRVYPGDGVAPLKTLFQDLRTIGFHGMLSIELFNRAYWKLDAETVLKTAIGKLRTAVKASLDASPGT